MTAPAPVPAQTTHALTIDGATVALTIPRLGGTCVIVRYHGAGTCDVKAPNGSYYRVSGLALREPVRETDA